MIASLRLALVAAFISLALPAVAADKAWPIDHVLGKDDAPVTVIEYSSLTCPHCATFFETNQARIKSELIDTGKIRLVFRDFPIDPVALAAAMVAQCSNDRYFSFIDAFFHSQQSWAQASDPLAAIKSIGRLGGMSEDKVDACIADRSLMQSINARKSEAVEKYGIDAVPSFVVNGKVKTGEMTYDEFVKMLK